MNILINGLNIHYDIKGDGNPLVILHGWGANLESFRPVIDYFSKKFKVIALDFPGFGESEEPKVDIGVYEYADIVEKFLNELNIINPILMGHSFGGRISIILSSRLSIKKLILIDSAGIKPKRKFKYYLKVYTFKFIKFFASLPGINLILKDFIEEYKNHAGSSDYRNASPMMKKILIKVVNEDLSYLLSEIKAETLIIWGENDSATPIDDARIMEKNIKDSGMVVLKGAGHFSYIEKLNEFLIIIDKYLEKDV